MTELINVTRSNTMKLIFLPANRVWAFAFGDSLVPLNGRTLFATKKEALAAANALGIKL